MQKFTTYLNLKVKVVQTSLTLKKHKLSILYTLQIKTKLQKNWGKKNIVTNPICDNLILNFVTPTLTLLSSASKFQIQISLKVPISLSLIQVELLTDHSFSP